jgi:hypothetical protein
VKGFSRRRFLGNALLTGGVLTSSFVLPAELAAAQQQEPVANPAGDGAGTAGEPVEIDFRHAPVVRQTAFCFPDDHLKSLIHQNGRLVYGYDRYEHIDYFPLKVGFALLGMEEARPVKQTLESPSVPIVQTVLERTDATMKLTTFATNMPKEGRVDNVLVEILPKDAMAANVAPRIEVHSIEKYEQQADGGAIVLKHVKTGEVLLAAKVFENPNRADLHGYYGTQTNVEQQLMFHAGVAAANKPYRAFIRFPQAKQTLAQILDGLNNPDAPLASARKFWAGWRPFEGPVSWQVPGRQGEFVTACARNILQAREVRDGKLTFQVGPTCYRGLWVVDGNFILEAARYLGYDHDAIEGLKTTWSHQRKNGQIVAGGGLEHYKDTAIAMFTLVRQCELSQDWTLLHAYKSHVAAALEFIESLRTRSRAEGGVMGRHGLLPKGFSDGGLGIGIEFTNTLWTMAGLKAIGKAGERQHIPEIARATKIYRELYAGFNQAATDEMKSFRGKFEYLPMRAKEDPSWLLPDPWDRPRPQSAQWALSHTIFPGRVFSPDHPVLKGHVDLMKAVRQEEIPAETGWLHHEGVWNYNAAFVAEVYLWLGMRQAAHDTFVGFLNHASPQYCWREEQPLRNALVAGYVGDMPHNWASAECIRYVRHMLVLEDGDDLRLLAGITQAELASGKPHLLKGSPTRFGRIDAELEPVGGGQSWQLHFRRAAGPRPSSVSVPVTLGSRFQLAASNGVKRKGSRAIVDPSMTDWTLTWRA